VDRQVIRGSGLIGGGDPGPSTLLDVNDGAITRIRPLPYERSYDRKGFNAWKIGARGKTLEPPLRAPVGPIGLSHRKRVYSKNRVRYPLKRVDWDQAGERNPQNQGVSGYASISWDEAAELVAAEK
jgi:anaerobic selenocysteine-containing dehydrogenase